MTKKELRLLINRKVIKAIKCFLLEILNKPLIKLEIIE